MPRPGRTRTVLLVLVYTGVFCVALPGLLWQAGLAIDHRLGWRLAPTALGALPAAWGALWLAAGMRNLWSHGGDARGPGLPVSAVPPPRLVTRGPYVLVRHPIYAGFNLLLLGAGLLVGAPGLALVVAPLFLPVWMAYARWEERGLLRRFGADYERYRQSTPLLPRPSLRPLMRLLQALGLIRVRVLSGREHLPGRGPAVLVSNHTTYADPVFLAALSPRRVWMATTAEAFRGRGAFRFLVRAWPSFPVRRFRPDPSAARRLIDLLAAGEVVGLFNERERSVLGAYLGTDERVAALLPRLGVPVIPVALQDAYASGPRWSGTLRLPTIHARVGPPIDWRGGSPAACLDRAMRALLDQDPQPVWLEREHLDRLYRAVWRCPRCLDEAGWQPAALRCTACGAAWTPSGDGGVRGPEGQVQAFADWAAPVWQAPETGPLEVEVEVSRAPEVSGPIQDLLPQGRATLRLGPEGLNWDGQHLGIRMILSTSTERADTLQVGTLRELWQFRCPTTSPFRLQRALDRWRQAEEQRRPRHRPLRRAPILDPEPAPVAGPPGSTG